MEERSNVSFIVNMNGNRLDMSANKDELVLTANVEFWANIYVQLKELFVLEDLEDAKSNGSSAKESRRKKGSNRGT
jgi:hypothetical protein